MNSEYVCSQCDIGYHNRCNGNGCTCCGNKKAKAQKLAPRIKKLIFSKFDDHNFIRGFQLLERYNTVHCFAYHGEKFMTPGQMVDCYLEQRVFESRF